MAFPWLLALNVGSTALQLFGGKEKGEAQQETAEWNAAMARYDAAQAKVKAQLDEASLRREGEINELLRRREEKLEIGSFRAKAGASGLATDSITNQAVIQDIMKRYELESELERRNIEWDASVIRYQGEAESQRSMLESELYKREGKQAKRASYFDMGTTVLSSAYNIGKSGLLKIK